MNPSRRRTTNFQLSRPIDFLVLSLCGCTPYTVQSRIHERTISLRFLGIILRVLILEVCVYNVYVHYKPVSNHFCSRGRRSKKSVVEVTMNSKEKSFCPNCVQEFGFRIQCTWFSVQYMCTCTGSSYGSYASVVCCYSSKDQRI